jgi:cytochrome c biogenesis protein CcmG/thiol:disulfide interchange protein DsbE
MSKRRRVNPFVLVVGLAITGALVAVLASGFGKDPHAVPSVLEGKPAPEFTLVDLDGGEISLASLRGKPVVVNFWSTWCMPCKIEHPLLLQAPAAFPDVTFIGVLYADEADAARRYLKREGAAFRHFEDPGGRAALDFGVAGVPETFFIDAEGTIVYKQVGPLDGQTLRVLVDRARSGS